MFSGFSNQVNSWMGAVKGEPHDEEVPTPTAQQAADAAAAHLVAEADNGDAATSLNQQQLDEVAIDGGAVAGGDGANVQRWVYMDWWIVKIDVDRNCTLYSQRYIVQSPLVTPYKLGEICVLVC